MFEYKQNKVTHNKFFEEKKECNGKKLYNNKIENVVTHIKFTFMLIFYKKRKFLHIWNEKYIGQYTSSNL